MKILLVTPPFEEEWRAPLINHDSHYPLGLAYIHSYLEEKCHTVQTLFLNDYAYVAADRIVSDKLRTFAPDIIGLNMLTSNRVSCYSVIEYVQRKYPDTQIVIGGIHATDMYEQILRKYPEVIAVRGEGEVVMGNLVAALEANADLSTIKGIAYTQKDPVSGLPVVKATDEEELIWDLDSLPFPKHDVFFHENRTIACLLTSRGCPYACSYCVLDAISRRRVRFRSVENVMNEIEELISKYPRLTTIWIHDDVFFIKPKRAIEFCDEIVRRNIKLKIICSGRFKPFTKELAEALQRAGCETVMFGLETGSATLLKSAHKNIKKEEIIETITVLKDSKIEPICFLIVGLPGEDDATVEETIAFVKRMQKIRYFHYSDIGTLTIYPGTEVYAIAKARNFMDDSYWLGSGPAPLYTVEHELEKLRAYKNRILDAIALERIFSVRGFKAQADMSPYILKSLFRGTPHYRKVIASLLIKAVSPKLYQKLKAIYLGAPASKEKTRDPNHAVIAAE